MIVFFAACFVLLAALVFWQFYLAIVEREKFADERREWQQERAELLTRIQAPEAAPFLFEAKPEDAENDLPLPPDFTVDSEELERAQQELESVGYSDGPAA